MDFFRLNVKEYQAKTEALKYALLLRASNMNTLQKMCRRIQMVCVHTHTHTHTHGYIFFIHLNIHIQEEVTYLNLLEPEEFR